MLRYYSRQKETKNTLKNIFENKNNVFIIHYSCESFYDIENGRTPRITSIAVKHLNSEIDVSFSIHKIAEIEGQDNIPDNYNDLEKKMLDEFYSFVEKHENYSWIHWNMKNINYGFEAIAHRYRVLKGNPIIIPNEKVINLAKLLCDIYGCNYIENPKLYNLVKENNLKHKDLLDGAEEGEAFQNKDYVTLHRSTLKKVDAIYNLLDLAYLGKLKTKATFIDKNGGLFMIIPYFILENPYVATFITIFGFIFGLTGLVISILSLVK